MKPSLALLILSIIGCTNQTEPLLIKQYTLRDQEPFDRGAPMVEHEKKRRLHGAVSMAERKSLLGQYYTILWNETQHTDSTGEIIFLYQQGATGSLVKKMRRPLAPGETSGTVEFAIIGDDYFKNGRVLAWKISLVRGGKLISEKKSYLWD